MAERERLVEFQLLGQEFRFCTAASDEELEQVLTLVRTFVEGESAEQRMQDFPFARVAVLACLNMASRYVNLEREFALYRRDTSRRLEQTGRLMSSCLEERNR